MSEEQAAKPEPRFSESEVREVLERAARLESGQGGLSATELQRVAEEAGFSTESVSRAIEDILASRSVTVPQESPPVPRADAPSGVFRKTTKWVRTLTSAAVGGVVGFLSAAGWRLGGTNPELVGVLLLGGVLLSRALHHRRDGDMEGYQREALGIWGGFGTAWLVAMTFISRVVVTPVDGFIGRGLLVIALFWLISAGVGALIIQGGRDPSGDEPLPRAGR